PAGVLAPAGLFARDPHRPELGAEHEEARARAEALSPRRGVTVEPVETSRLFCRLEGRSAEALRGALRDRGIAVNAVGPNRVRMVTHRDVSLEDCLRAAQVVGEILRGGLPA